MKAALEDAQPQAARMDARPHPRHVDAVVFLAELADQQRAEELVVARRAHVAHEPLVGGDAFERLPEGRQLEERAASKKRGFASSGSGSVSAESGVISERMILPFIQ